MDTEQIREDLELIIELAQYLLSEDLTEIDADQADIILEAADLLASIYPDEVHEAYLDAIAEGKDAKEIAEELVESYGHGPVARLFGVEL